MARSLGSALAAAIFTLILGGPALAGGWAVTTLDQLPPDIQPGQTYAIGYAIRQHGVTPVNVERTEIRVTSPDGATTLVYPAIQQGATGHYVANVTFPSAGTWTWQVTQGMFAPQALGPVAVGAAAAVQASGSVAPSAPVASVAPAQIAPAASEPRPAGPNGLLLTALILASAGAAILFGSRLAVFADRHASA